MVHQLTSSSAFLAPRMDKSKSLSPSPLLRNESSIEARLAGGAGYSEALMSNLTLTLLEPLTSSSSHHLPPDLPPNATPSPTAEGVSLASLIDLGGLGGTVDASGGDCCFLPSTRWGGVEVLILGAVEEDAADEVDGLAVCHFGPLDCGLVA